MSMNIDSVSKVNKELMAILGIDPTDKPISSIVVIMTPSEYPEVSIAYDHVTTDGLEQDKRIFKLMLKDDQ